MPTILFPWKNPFLIREREQRIASGKWEEVVRCYKCIEPLNAKTSMVWPVEVDVKTYFPIEKKCEKHPDFNLYKFLIDKNLEDPLKLCPNCKLNQMDTHNDNRWCDPCMRKKHRLQHHRFDDDRGWGA